MREWEAYRSTFEQYLTKVSIMIMIQGRLKLALIILVKLSTSTSTVLAAQLFTSPGGCLLSFASLSVGIFGVNGDRLRRSGEGYGQGEGGRRDSVHQKELPRPGYSVFCV